MRVAAFVSIGLLPFSRECMTSPCMVDGSQASRGPVLRSKRCRASKRGGNASPSHRERNKGQPSTLMRGRASHDLAQHPAGQNETTNHRNHQYRAGRRCSAGSSRSSNRQPMPISNASDTPTSARLLHRSALPDLAANGAAARNEIARSPLGQKMLQQCVIPVHCQHQQGAHKRDGCGRRNSRRSQPKSLAVSVPGRLFVSRGSTQISECACGGNATPPPPTK